jgi:hypothetical protein
VRRRWTAEDASALEMLSRKEHAGLLRMQVECRMKLDF